MNVLLVEDSDVVRAELEALLLGLSGIERVTPTAGVEAARAALEHGAFGLWVLDFRLADGTALDLLADLPDGPAVLVVTAHPTPSLRRRCLRSGADRVLDKAGGGRELAAAVDALCGSRADPGFP